MILDRTPLSMNEVEDILKEIPDNEKKQEIELFIKKFMNAKPAQAKKIREDLEKLDLAKMKQEHIIKLIDMLPQDVSDVNKIFIDVSLTEDETKKILDIIKDSK
ncbi:MAG: hypothetical protein RL557_478 [archaeon]